MKVFGIDIGGTGIKGGVVDTKRGVLKSDRLRLLTPHPANPDDVAEVVRKLVSHFDWDGHVGCTYPGVVQNGISHTAANLTPDWIGLDVDALFTKATGCDVTVLNDADAAGLAEVRFGAAAGHRGTVLLLTLGTGIGSALIADGQLVRNTELGHIKLHGDDAERYASGLVRETEKLDYPEWAARLTEYLELVEGLLWPDLFILGGGISKNFDKFSSHLTCRTPVVAAKLHNLAGIVGAAIAAESGKHQSSHDKGKGKGKGK